MGDWSRSGEGSGWRFSCEGEVGPTPSVGGSDTCSGRLLATRYLGQLRRPTDDMVDLSFGAGNPLFSALRDSVKREMEPHMINMPKAF